MKAVVVDDEDLAREYLVRTLKEADDRYEICDFADPRAALKFISSNKADIAFLDVEMFEMNGIELAKQVKERQPEINIIFVTGFPEYAVDAFRLHASGYLLKPASVESIKTEIANLRVKPERQAGKLVEIHTFGNFEVFYNNIPLEFSRSKTKELLAYLVDRKGAGCNAAELCAILWEDKEYNISMQKQFQTIVSDLLKALRKIGSEDIIIKKRNFLCIDTEKVDCDYYHFLAGDVAAVNSYMGEYMSNYSWAEFTTGFLYQMSQK